MKRRWVLPCCAGLLLLALVACDKKQPADTPPALPENTPAPTAVTKDPAPHVPAFTDILPTMKGPWVEGMKGDFVFPVPTGWRVVPLDEKKWKKQMGLGFEEMLLRPDLSLDAVPYIRVRRMLGQSFKYHLFKGDESGAALHLLMQFVGGTHNPSVVDSPLLDMEQGRMSFHFTTGNATGRVNYATFYFLPTFTVMIQGSWADAAAKIQQKAAFDFVNAGFKVRRNTP